jgi:hypothetical protein
LTTLKEPTIADAMAGVSLPDPRLGPSFESVSTLEETLLNNAMEEVKRRELNTRQVTTTFGEQASSIITDMAGVELGRNIYERFANPYLPDPAFSTQRYEQLLKEMSPELSPEYYHRLEGAVSEEHMRALFAQAKAFERSRKTYEELGMAWMPAYVAGMIFDPINIIAGVGSVGGAWRLSAMLGGSGVANLLTQGAFGAGAGVATELAREAIGYERLSKERLIAAAAFGSMAATAFAPFLKNPHIRLEAAATEQAARTLLQQAATGRLNPFVVKELEEAVAQRAAIQAQERAQARAQRQEIRFTGREMAEQEAMKQFGPDWVRMTSTPEGLELRSRYLKLFNDPNQIDSNAINRARAEITRFLRPDPSPVPPPVREILESPEAAQIRPYIDDLVARAGQEAPTPKATPETPSAAPETPAISTPADEFARMRVEDDIPPTLDANLRDLAPPKRAPEPGPRPVPAQFADNPNFMGEWNGTDGAVYRIMASPRDGSFTVTQVGKGTVARGVSDFQEAMSHVPLVSRGVGEMAETAPASVRLKEALNRLDTVDQRLKAQGNTREGLDAIRELMQETPPAIKSSARLDVEDVLQRVLPKGTKFKVMEGMIPFEGSDRMVIGKFSAADKLVWVSMKSDDPLRTAYHEGLHALRAAGAFTRGDWNKLLKYSQRTGVLERYNLVSRYNEVWPAIERHIGRKLTDAERADLMAEEAIAFATAEYLRGVRFGGIMDKMMAKAERIFARIIRFLGEKGYRTAEEIFQDIDSGAAAARARQPNTVGPTVPELPRNDEWDVLADDRFRSVSPDSVPGSAEARIKIGPLSFRLPRFDMESATGTSRNPLSRLFSGHFVHNTVGMSDNSLTAMPAELRMRRAVAQYGTEFQSTFNPAWKEWAKDMGVKPAEWFKKQEEFSEKIGLYAAGREGLPDSSYHPAVRRMGDKLRKLYADQLKDMQQPGWRDGMTHGAVEGAEMIGDNVHYAPRIFDQAKVRNVINRFEKDDIVKLVAKAINEAQPIMPPAYLNKIAEGYIRSIVNNALDVGDDWVKAINGKDFGRLEAVLQRHTSLTADEIADVMNRYRTKPAESGFDRLKHRLFLNEAAELENARLKGGGTETLAFRDLLDNNAARVFDRYTRRVQGRVALARVRIAHPDTGDVLIDGIRSEEDFTKMLRIMREYGTDYLRNREPDFQKIIDRDEEYFKFFYNRIIAVADPEQSKDYAKWLRRVRKYNVTRLLGQVGVAQLGEQGEVTGTLGVRAAFQKVPGFKRIIDAAGDSRAADQVSNDLERMGIGGERLHGMTLNNLQDLGDMPFEVRPESQTWKRWLDNGLELGQKATFEMSGMAFIQQQQQRHTAAAIMSWFADAFAKKQATGAYAEGIQRRLAQLSIDPAMMDRIGAQLQTKVGWKSGPNKRLASLNLDKWDDLEARMHFEEAVYRFTNKLVQQQDVGSMARWMSHPVAQTLFQFRNFPLQAWANKLQYNLHMADFSALMALTWGVAWNAAVRAVQITALAAARSDGEEYKEKYLTPFELGKAGFERGGMSSILPMGIDSVLALTGQQGIFNARSSGLGQSIIQSPSLGLLDSASKGLGGLIDSTFRDRELSQAEVRALASTLPFMNQIQFSMLLSTLISDMPVRAPRKQPLFE